MGRISSRISSDLFLICTSLIISCVIWTIAKSSDREQAILNVRIVLKSPTNIIARPARDSAQVTVTYPKSLQSHIQAGNFVIRASWEDLPDPHSWCGIDDFAKSPAPISIEPHQVIPAPGLSQELRDRIEKQVKYTTIIPSKITVEARFITRPAKIVFQTVNRPADGHVAGSVAPTVKQTVLLTATPERFAELGAPQENAPVEIATEPIDLSNRKTPFSERVRLKLPADVELVHSTDQQVEVQVPVHEVYGRRTIDKVPIQVRPASDQLNVEYGQKVATVTVQGPMRILKLLKPTDLVVRPEQMPSEQGGLETTVTLQGFFSDSAPAGEAREGAEIVSVSPKTLRIVYIWRQPPAPAGNPWLIPTR